MLYCKPLPPIEELRHRLALRSDGHLIWKRPRSNRAKPGSIAGRWGKLGYRYTMFNGSSYANHRLAWALHHGEDPGSYEIDHINGNPSDNRPCNLRLCTRGQNILNTKDRRTNTSGIRGVSYDPSSVKNPWRAYLRKKRLGRFATKEEAEQALIKEIEQDVDKRFYPRQDVQ